MIGLRCSIVIYITNLWTYLLHKRTCNKVRYIPNWYNEKNVMYIPNLVNVMYIKRIISLWLTCSFTSIVYWCGKNHIVHICLPPNIKIKKLYKQSCQCYVYKKYSLLLTDFELHHLFACIKNCIHTKVIYIQNCFSVNRGIISVRLKTEVGLFGPRVYKNLPTF